MSICQFVASWRNVYLTVKEVAPHTVRRSLISDWLPSANEVSEGCVFTSVCQSFCSQGGWCASRGICIQRWGCTFRGGSASRGVSIKGGSAFRGVLHLGEVSAFRIGAGVGRNYATRSMRGRYRSYWNVFLFKNSFMRSSVRIFCHKHDKKFVLIDNHYKSIYVLVRSEFSSCRVQAWRFISENLSLSEMFSKLGKKVANSPLKIDRSVKSELRMV